MKAGGSGRVVGGRSLWGNLFDVLIAKYHWTMDYLLWGISFMNVYMLMSDNMEVFYDGKDTKDVKTINAGDPANRDLVRQVIDE